MEDIGALVNFGIPVCLIVLALITGTIAERRHFRDLKRGEDQLSHMLLTDIKTFPGGSDPEKRGELVMGQAVIASDYLKTFIAGIVNIFGGEMKSYESLMTRARRQAIVRMLQEADRKGFNAVCNLRVDSADIGGMTGKRGAAMVEAFVSGTAYCMVTGSHDE